MRAGLGPASIATALLLLLPSCRGERKPDVPSEPSVATSATCPAMRASYIPDGFAESRRSPTSEGNTSGLVITYSKGDQEITLLSGVSGDILHGSGEEVGRTEVRGFQAKLYRLSDTLVATWNERTPDEPCSQYAVVGTNIDRSEFDRVLSSIS